MINGEPFSISLSPSLSPGLLASSLRRPQRSIGCGRRKARLLRNISWARAEETKTVKYGASKQIGLTWDSRSSSRCRAGEEAGQHYRHSICTKKGQSRRAIWSYLKYWIHEWNFGLRTEGEYSHLAASLVKAQQREELLTSGMPSSERGSLDGGAIWRAPLFRVRAPAALPRVALFAFHQINRWVSQPFTHKSWNQFVLLSQCLHLFSRFSSRTTPLWSAPWTLLAAKSPTTTSDPICCPASVRWRRRATLFPWTFWGKNRNPILMATPLRRPWASCCSTACWWKALVARRKIKSIKYFEWIHPSTTPTPSGINSTR